MKTCLLIFCFTLSSFAQWKSLDRAIQLEVEKHHLSSLSLAISDSEKTLYRSHLGAANEKSVYRAGSITKLFTAIAIMQLAEAGKLDLDQPVTRYLPELKLKNPFNTQPTLRRLLSHRAGIVREPGKGHYFDPSSSTLREVTASLNGTSLVYAPGTTTKYSNAAFSLLGDVIERVGNESYEAYLYKHIWQPIGLQNTYLQAAKVPAGLLPKAAMWTLDGREFPAPVFDLGTASAGNLITSTEDILRLARWLLRDNPLPVLSAKSLAAMWVAQEGGTRFGIGFALEKWGDDQVVGHGGAVYGFSALLQIIPQRKWAAVAFAAKDSVGFALHPLLQFAANPSANYQASNAPNLQALEPQGPQPAAFQSGVLGEYGWDFNKLYILEHAGKIHSLVEWFSLNQLEPLGKGRYRFPDRSMYAGEILSIQAKGLHLGPVWFPRLPEPNRSFRVQMQKPLAELRQIAKSSTPPIQPPGLRTPDLVNLRTLSPTILFDIRYATGNNFMGAPLYSQPAAWFQRPAAEALLQAHRALGAQGFGLLIHDSYRPWLVTKMFWEATPEAQRNFVANPSQGSRHNRGCAVDLSLYDLKTGRPVEMPSGYDEFSDRAYPDYPGGTSRPRWLRSLLKKAMEAQGFTVNEDEWWHFDYRDWRQYPVMNLSFEQLGSR